MPVRARKTRKKEKEKKDNHERHERHEKIEKRRRILTTENTEKRKEGNRNLTTEYIMPVRIWKKRKNVDLSLSD